MSDSLRIYIIAGEPSGDVLGGRLIAALHKLSEHPIDVFGVGGPHMAAEGLETLFPMNDLTVMGVAEVLPRLPLLLKRIKQTASDIRAKAPDVIVTIDAPDFCFRVAKRVRETNIPIVHYVAPSVWAWRPGRAKKVAKLADHVLCLLPFEPPYFVREGMKATFVGHSILESDAGKGEGAKFREKHGISTRSPALAVLPGSRMSEVTRLIPVFEDVIVRLLKRLPDLQVIVPTVSSVASYVREQWGKNERILIIEEEADKYNAMVASSAALAASGTVSLELAIARVPSVIAYRVSPITAAIARRLLKIKHVSITNLIAGREVMPEFLQEKCRSDLLSDALFALLDHEPTRTSQIAEQDATLKALSAPSGTPSQAAARVVLEEAERRPNA